MGKQEAKPLAFSSAFVSDHLTQVRAFAGTVLCSCCTRTSLCVQYSTEVVLDGFALVQQQVSFTRM